MVKVTTTYDKNVDYKMLEEFGVRVVKHQPWQFGLFYPDLEGKMVWYPEKGTLMYENSAKRIMKKVGEFTDTEDVWNEIMKRVKK